jgi:hypothetical protein
MHRRAYLATVGSVALAGCSVLSGSASIERVEWESRETETTATGEVVRGTIALEVEQFANQGFFGVGAPTLAWQVAEVSGGAVDVWVVSQDEFDAFSDGDEFQFVRSLSERRISTASEAEGRVDGAEDWYVVFDNTGRGDSTAQDRVEFRAAAAIGG